MGMHSKYGENQVAFLGDYSSDKERGTLMLYTGGKKNTVIDEDVRYILPSRPDNFGYILKLSYLF